MPTHIRSTLVPEVPEFMLLIGDGHGVYIPQLFAQWYADYFRNIDSDDVEILLQGPKAEHYWEAWDDILCKAVHRDYGWTLHQDGSLFLIGPEFDTEILE